MSDFLGGIAAKIYNQSESGGGGVQSFIPRSRFQFKTTIHYKGASRPLVLERVSEVQMPGHIFKTAIVNQYNRKRLVNTGVDYTNVYINAYDTRDGEIEQFLKKYAEYYYSGPMSTDGKTEMNYADIVTENFATGNSGKGLKLVEDKYFITKIEISRWSSADDVNTVSMYSPMITGVSGDTLNYSDSAPAQYRIEFSYEGYDISSSSARGSIA